MAEQIYSEEMVKELNVLALPGEHITLAQYEHIMARLSSDIVLRDRFLAILEMLVRGE